MLTKLRLTNFKRFDDVEIDLATEVVFIGPNNSGKTTALQALTLWEVGLRRWLSKRNPGSQADIRQGVAVSRRDLLAVPVPSGRMLWRDLVVRNVSRVADGSDVGADDAKPKTRQITKNVMLGITVSGVSSGEPWECGLEFDYANEESFYVRPLRVDDANPPSRMTVPDAAAQTRIALLPPMSGLTSEEFIKQPGEVAVLIGQGQTAQVLRNLCYRVCYPIGNEREPSDQWHDIVNQIDRLFGARLLPPDYTADRGEIRMQYHERAAGACTLDISSSGRGLQQTLLLLAYIYNNPNTVLLLDEPDAHLEVLRQRHTYRLIQEVSRTQGIQIIAASHSEAVLNEAAETGTIVAFVGKPHKLTGHPRHVVRSLTEVGWDQYYEAELTGWALYLEGSTDLEILRAFAKLLEHPVLAYLDKVFVKYVGDNPESARKHFHGLREAKPDLVGIALFDRLDKQLHSGPGLIETMWTRREIENYFCSEKVLLRWASPLGMSDLFSVADRDAAILAMRGAIEKVTAALALDRKEPWSVDVKATDEVLDRVFYSYFMDRRQHQTFYKGQYSQLVDLLDLIDVDPEVVEKLDMIARVAESARPTQ